MLLQIVQCLLNYPSPELEIASCLRIRHKQNQCERCLRVCPEGAIKLNLAENLPEIETGKCNYCGMCQFSCPSEALGTPDFFKRLETCKSSDNPVKIGCFKTASISTLQIACLKFVTPDIILRLIARKLPVEILYAPSNCQSCCQNWNPDSIRVWLDEINLEFHSRVKFVKAEKARENVSRRDFFVASHEKLQSSFSTVLESFEEKCKIGLSSDLNLRKKIKVTRKRRFFNELITINDFSDRRFSAQVCELIPINEKQVSENCTMCGRCAKICPTGALQLSDENDYLSLNYCFMDCIDCGICELECPNISRKGYEKKSIGELHINHQLKKVSMNFCNQCGRKKPDNLDLCENCNNTLNFSEQVTESWI